MFGLGNLFFTLILEGSNGVHIYDIMPKGVIFVIIGIGALLAIFPSKALSNKVFKIVDQITEVQTYDEARTEFDTDYDIQNPVTSKEGLHDYLKMIKQKKHTIKDLGQQIRSGVFVLLAKQAFLKSLEKANTKEKRDEAGFELLDDYAYHVSTNMGPVNRKGHVHLADLLDKITNSQPDNEQNL